MHASHATSTLCSYMYAASVRSDDRLRHYYRRPRPVLQRRVRRARDWNRGAMANQFSAPDEHLSEQALTLLELSADSLGKVLTSLDPDDELAASLACRALRDAVRAQRRQRTLKTRVRSLLVSAGKLQWGVACAGAPLSATLFTDVAGLGSVRMLSWLRARGCAWPAANKLAEYSGGPCAHAAAGGHLCALRWLHSSGCPWDDFTCSQAARGGHLSALKWLRANGCPWKRETCSQAAKGGHLPALQWLHANGSPWNEETCSEAAKGGHLPALQWLQPARQWLPLGRRHVLVG